MQGLRHHRRSMHEKMFHSIEDRAEITVTIKLITSCNAEHKVKQLNKETSDKIVIKQQTLCNAEHKEKQKLIRKQVTQS